MINKKVSRIIGPVAGMMGIVMVMETVPVSVYAADTTVSQNNQSVYEVEENGVKFKITDILATKHKIKVKGVIERKDASIEMDHKSLNLNLYMDNFRDQRSKGMSWGNINENLVEVEADIETEDVIPENGELVASLILGKYDFNKSIVIPLDLRESLSKVIEKDLNEKVNDNAQIVKFESDIIGTRIVINEKYSDEEYGFSHNDKTDYIIKIGDNIYRADSISGDYDDDNENLSKTIEYEDVTYDDIKEGEKISIIHVELNMEDRELENYYRNEYENIDNNKVVENNIKYNNEIEFKNGNKGKIQVERADNKIKFYCASESDKDSLLMAINIFGGYTDNKSINGKSRPVVYKDNNKEHVYVVEYKDTDKDGTFETYLDGRITYNDKFEFGNEISIG